jgi:hypothetical protein
VRVSCGRQFGKLLLTNLACSWHDANHISGPQRDMTYQRINEHNRPARARTHARTHAQQSAIRHVWCCVRTVVILSCADICRVRCIVHLRVL